MDGFVVSRYSGVRRPTMHIERRVQRDGRAKWAVTENGACLSKDGEWEYEPIQSSRDDDFLIRCRYDTLEDALTAANAEMMKFTHMDA